jgi:hypothetical protein
MTMVTGGCQCGAIRYEAKGQPAHSALCHCSDCRKSAGAHMVAWTLFDQADVAITGTPKRYRSSAHAERHFCEACGTGLFYTSEVVFPGKIDIRAATFDDLTAFPPSIQIQLVDAPPWMDQVHTLPKFERFPPQG